MKNKLQGLFLFQALIGSFTFAEPPDRPDHETFYFWGFSRSKPNEMLQMQQRGYDAVQQVSVRLESLGAETHLLQSPVMDTSDRARRPVPSVSCEIARAHFQQWRETLSTNDTIIIYSHTHGIATNDERMGGLLLGQSQPGNPLIMSWAKYADELLDLPAKTIVVLTMACHSGELTDYLNTNAVAQQKLKQHRKSGCNFLVITSQNADSLSNPRRIEGQVINPFTYAAMKAFEGAADGYSSGDPDGTITLGELSTFILDETRKHTRLEDNENDPDPQMTGAFNPSTVLIPPAS